MCDGRGAKGQICGFLFMVVTHEGRCTLTVKIMRANTETQLHSECGGQVRVRRVALMAVPYVIPGSRLSISVFPAH